MSIPGRILKKIIDALISAFPTREKLVIMLRLQLDIVESYVPSGSDYEDVVYNLVNKVDNQGRIIELLEGAYQHNQGNFHLQLLKQDIIPLIELYQILNNVEKYLIDDIRQAYNQCCYDNLYTGDKIPFTETLQKILINLVDMPRCNASYSPTELFIVYLLVNIDKYLLPKQLDELRKLGNKYINNLTELLNEKRIEMLRREEHNSKTYVDGQKTEQKYQSKVLCPNNLLYQLQQLEFDVITVNSKGEEIKRERRQAQCFIENLGKNITLEMVAIPSGKFLMGSLKGEGNDNERPQHQVIVPSFFMGGYLITQAQWRLVAALPKIERDLKPEPFDLKGDNHPVDRVSWYDAIEFCARLSQKTGRLYRLPSEAEWEYACRAGTTTPFHFGETITDKLANYCASHTKFANEPKGKYRSITTDVGTFPPNAFGLHDMHGNVWEWCLDTYHDNYNGAPSDGSTWVDQTERKDKSLEENQGVVFRLGKLLENILKSEKNNSKLLRGGSWNYDPQFCRSAFRNTGTPFVGDYDLGFRVVCSDLTITFWLLIFLYLYLKHFSFFIIKV